MEFDIIRMRDRSILNSKPSELSQEVPEEAPKANQLWPELDNNEGIQGTYHVKDIICLT